MNSSMGNALWSMIAQSDAITVVVLLVLLGMSILCWSLFIYKYLIIRKNYQDCAAAYAKLQFVKSIEELSLIGTQYTGSPVGSLLRSIVQTAKELLSAHDGLPVLTQEKWHMIQLAAEQKIQSLVHAQEAYLPVLSTSAAVATLFGLFGTVWGIIHAFLGISQHHSADIATVAPGIAEALITTLGGLIVAIPALIMYNYLASRVNGIEHALSSVADRAAWIMYHHYNK